jgi:hypothetical protein
MIKDLTKKKFGNWLVLNDSGERNKSGNVMWECLCLLCNNKKLIPTANLKSGNV